MVRTPSTMLPLGTIAPDFTLPDTNGTDITLESVSGDKALLVVFMCNHCPFVIHIESELASIARDYDECGLSMVGISSNDVSTHPDDGPEHMKTKAASAGYNFPYLYDESQEVAKAYRAACTPDIFLFDENNALVYRGQLDDSRPGNDVPVTGSDLRAAIDAVLSGQSVTEDQKPSLGCNIKWKAGNEPDYFG